MNKGIKTVKFIKCKQVSKLVMDYVDDKLKPRTKRLFEKHIKDCNDCDEFFKSFKKTIDGVKNLKEVEMKEEVFDRLLKFIEKLKKR